MIPCSGNPTPVSVLALGALLLLFTIIACIFKLQKTRKRAANVIKTDENATYGDHSDPNYRMEVEDTNDYYSSDYEAGTGTRTTDINPYYE